MIEYTVKTGVFSYTLSGVYWNTFCIGCIVTLIGCAVTLTLYHKECIFVRNNR